LPLWLVEGYPPSVICKALVFPAIRVAVVGGSR
jgi:hypothetical protein